MNFKKKYKIENYHMLVEIIVDGEEDSSSDGGEVLVDEVLEKGRRI